MTTTTTKMMAVPDISTLNLGHLMIQNSESRIKRTVLRSIRDMTENMKGEITNYTKGYSTLTKVTPITQPKLDYPIQL